MNREDTLRMLDEMNFDGWKVRDVLIWAHEHLNGNREIYNIRTRTYIDSWNNEVLNLVPKKVTFHRGYGFGQINTVVRVFMPKK